MRKGFTDFSRYLAAYQLPQERALLHIFGQYGTGTVLADLAGFAFVTRGKECAVLDHPLVQARLHLPPDQLQQRAAEPGSPLSSNCTCIAVHYAPALSDEDQEIDLDRYCSHSAWGQECWQGVAQWAWNEAPGTGASASS